MCINFIFAPKLSDQKTMRVMSFKKPKVYKICINFYIFTLEFSIRKTTRAANLFIIFHNLVKRNKLQSLQLNFLLLIHGMKLGTKFFSNVHLNSSERGLKLDSYSMYIKALTCLPKQIQLLVCIRWDHIINNM